MIKAISSVYHAEKEELSAKRRCLIINDEIYVEDGNYLVPMSEIKYNQEVQTEEINTGREKSEIQSSFSKSNINDENSLGQDDNTEIKTEDALSSETYSPDSADDESSDDMVIISDDEQLLKKDAASEVTTENKGYIYRRNISSLIKFFENGVPIHNLNPEKCESPIESTEENRNETKDKPKGSIVNSVELNAMDHFPITFSKKMALSTIGVNQAESNTTKSSKKTFSDCPYCNFKLTISKIPRHIVFKHIVACICEECNTVTLPSRLTPHKHNNSNKLKCFKCSFASNCREQFFRHLVNIHRDSIYGQCGVCGERLKKNKLIDSQIQTLVEHVISKHLSQPEHLNSCVKLNE